MSKEIKQRFFNKLAEKLEEIFEKGERCECGKKLPCRSKALSFNAFANIFADEMIKELQELKIEKKADTRERCAKCNGPFLHYHKVHEIYGKNYHTGCLKKIKKDNEKET